MANLFNRTQKNEERAKKMRTGRIVCLVAAVMLCAFVVGGVYGKYTQNNEGEGVIRAKEFYFSSDHLTAECPVYELNAGTTSVSFNLKNHVDELRISEDEVKYTVSVEGGGSLSPANGKINGGTKGTAVIELSDITDGGTYTVTATGSAGYQEILQATFIVKTEPATAYIELQDAAAYVDLTVWTKNLAGNAVIEFPDGLIPNSTDPLLSGIMNYSSSGYTGTQFVDNASFQVPYASQTYRFFKEDITEHFTVVSGFSATVNGVAAVEP